MGVKPSDEYLLLMFVAPVGPYFKDGFKPVDMMISRNFDRTAPQGTGTVKVGGNYAASLLFLAETKKLGYSSTIYLDAKEKKYIDECGTAAVITPIKMIVDPVAGKEFTYGDGKNPGSVCTELFAKYTAIQFGEAEDPFGWTEVVEL